MADEIAPRRGSILSTYEATMVFLLTFTVPLRNFSLLELPGANIRVGDILILLGLGVLLVQWLLGGGSRWTWFDALLIAFVGLCLLSILWSLNPEFGVARSFKYARGLAFYALLGHALAQDYRRAFLLITAGMVGSFGYILGAIVHTFSTTALDLQALAAIQVASSGNLDAIRTDAIGGGTFAGTVNALAMWANASTFMLVGTGLWADRRRSLRWLFWFSFLVLLGLQLVTLSRGTWLGLAAGGLWWLWHFRGRYRVPALAYVGAVALMVGVAGWLHAREFDRLLIARIKSAGDASADGSIQERYLMWQAAWEAFLERPAGGVGMGGSAVIAEQNLFKDWYVHNMYIQILFELGLVGVMCWGGLLLAWFLSLWRRATTRTWEDAALWVGVQSASISLLVIGLTGNDFTEFEYWIVLALVGGIAAILVPRPARQWPTPVASQPA